MDFRVLGPVEARAEGRPLALAGARQRALLAVLLLRAGEPVSRERVIADLWGERPPDGAVKTVQAVVSRLRRALGGEAARLVSSAAGYRLRVEPDELDLGRFERLCAEGRRALAAGRHERAAARLRAALAEWRGPPLADVAFEPFAPPEVARLEDLRAAAVEDRVEADLAMGRGAELVAELEGLVAAEPLRERLRGQLMLALYRAGRQGEALDVYRDAVRTLDSELGLRPGPELERLQQAILAHDPALLRAPAGGEPREVERRRATATILVAEVAGWARVGDADADGVRAAHDRRLRDVLAAHGASAVKAVGDGVVAAFASAGAAIACAVEMQRAIDREARRGAVALELRVGVAAGDVAWAGEDYSGTPVIEAQRLCAAASAGSILVADAVRLLAGSGTEAELEDAGELELGDLARPVRAWSVGWTARRAVTVPFPASLVFDGGTAFAGREEELAGLRAAWADAVSGSRRGVLVSGEPGIGKTRLAAEIAAARPRARGRGAVRPLRRRPVRARSAVRPGAWRLRRGLPGRRAARRARRARERPGPAAARARGPPARRRRRAGSRRAGDRAAAHARGRRRAAGGRRRGCARAARARRPALGRRPVAAAAAPPAAGRRRRAAARAGHLPRHRAQPLAPCSPRS